MIILSLYYLQIIHQHTQTNDYKRIHTQYISSVQPRLEYWGQRWSGRLGDSCSGKSCRTPFPYPQDVPRLKLLQC